MGLRGLPAVRAGHGGHAGRPWRHAGRAGRHTGMTGYDGTTRPNVRARRKISAFRTVAGMFVRW